MLYEVITEGVAKAEAEAEQIISGAKARAASIVREAEAKAQEMTAVAEEEAKVFTERSRATLHQAARDLLLSVNFV